MAKLPLLRGKVGKPAAALLLSVLMPAGFSEMRAFADGESGHESSQTSGSVTPAPEKHAAEAPAKQPAAEAAQDLSKDAKPADAKPAEAKSAGDAAGPKDLKAEAKPSDAKPADAKPAEAKSAEAKSASDAAGPKDLKAEAKPADTKPAEATPANDTAAPKDVKAEVKPADAKPADAKAANDTAAPKEAKSEAKPADSKPAKAKHEGDGSAQKEARSEANSTDSGAKPRDLAPRLDSSDNLAVRSSNVNAVYNIHWLGTHIGEFKIRSAITNRQYSLQANADISVFFGAVSWQGVTTSHGLMTANGPVPQNYTFRYATSERHEALEIRFQQRMVSDIIINPPAHPGARSVPITAGDLQNVVDPLSAVILLSQARLSRHNGDACNKRLPIFDGKIRYDLVLSPKGTRSIGGSGKLHGVAYVCRVNYVPIAGHRPGKQGDYATGNAGIEIWLVPVPEAGLLVPYYVHVPTPAGTASMVTAKFDVDTPGGRHALAD